MRRPIFFTILGMVCILLPRLTAAETATTTIVITTVTSTPSAFATTTDGTAISTSSTIPTVTTTIPMSLRIEGPTSTIFYNTILLPSSCQVPAAATTTLFTINNNKAICALQTAADQKLLAYQATKWSFGFSLDQINDVRNASDWSQTWILYKNNISASVGIADLSVTSTDELLLTYGPWPMSPLSLAVSTTTPRVGDIIIATTSYYSGFGAATLLLTTTTFYTSNTATTTSSGLFSWIPTATGTLSVWTEAPNTTRSKKITVSVPDALITTPAVTTSTTSTSSATVATSSSSGTGSNLGGSSNPTTVSTTAPILISPADITSTTNKILTYLKSQLDSTGKIMDGGTTDWAIMSFGANSQYAADIKNGGQSLLDYARNFQITSSTDLNVCAGYPRHALALLAAGVAATDSVVTTLSQKMSGPECYANHQYGQNGINDDVFALLALLATGTSKDAPVIQDIVLTLKNDQTAAGAFTYAGWAAPDITGAAVNALKYAEQKGVIVSSTVYANGKAYLRSQQLADGGWGYGSSDVLTTSWALMGINALGESQTDWTTSTGKNPWYPLVSQLKPAGYYESSWAPGTVDWFATKSSIPALLGKSWPIILAAKQTDQTPPNQTRNSGSNSSNDYFTPIALTATTTATVLVAPAIVTSTVSSTIPIAIATSTVATINQQKLINEQPAAVSEAPALPTKPVGLALKTIAAEPVTVRQQTVTQESASTTQPSSSGQPQPDAEQLIAAPTAQIPLQSAARKVFGTATAMAGTLGAYLAWRFLQTLI